MTWMEHMPIFHSQQQITLMEARIADKDKQLSELGLEIDGLRKKNNREISLVNGSTPDKNAKSEEVTGLKCVSMRLTRIFF